MVAPQGKVEHPSTPTRHPSAKAMVWLTQLKVLPRWLIVARLAAALLVGVLIPVVLPALLPGAEHAACRQAVAEAVNRLFGL